MPDQKEIYRITVTGRVQGVGFRRACLREARFIGICGFVKNNPDGSVYIEAEGYPEQLNRMVAWCRRGPRFGFVEDLAVTESTALNYNSFMIRF